MRGFGGRNLKLNDMDLVKIFKETKGHLIAKAKAICEKMDINLEFGTEEYINSVCGCYADAYTKDNEIVLVGLKDKIDLFVFFHEIGHFILHKNIDFWSDTTKYEKEANDYAEEIIRKIYNKDKNINTLIWTCRNY